MRTNKMLKNLRNKMYKYIDEYGLNSEETLKISQEVDLEINNYYMKCLNSLIQKLCRML